LLYQRQQLLWCERLIAFGEIEGIGEEGAVAHLEVKYPVIFLKELRETTKNLSPANLCRTSTVECW